MPRIILKRDGRIFFHNKPTNYSIKKLDNTYCVYAGEHFVYCSLYLWEAKEFVSMCLKTSEVE